MENKENKDRLFLAFLKILVSTEKTVQLKIDLNTSKSYNSKNLEIKNNQNHVEFNQAIELDNDKFISKIKFELFEKTSTNLLFLRGEVDLQNKENVLKDECSNMLICKMTNSNGENIMDLYFNYEINQNLVDVYEGKLNSLIKQNSTNNKTKFEDFLDVANPESAEVFTLFIKNVAYLRIIFEEIEKFFTWKDPKQTMLIALIFTLSLIYFQAFFVIFPLLLISFHVINMKKINVYSLKNSEVERIKNISFIKSNLVIYNQMVDWYENTIEFLKNSQKKTFEKLYLNLVKLILFNLLFLLNPFRLNTIIMFSMWIILAYHNHSFVALVYFFYHFTHKHFLKKIDKSSLYTRIQIFINLLIKLVPKFNFLESEVKSKKIETLYEEVKSNDENLKINDDFKSPKEINEEEYKKMQESEAELNTKIKPNFLKFEVYENQRWWVLAGWTKNLLMNERQSWSDSTGHNILTKESVFLPNEKNYEWSSDWKVEISNLTDEHGWMYSNDFKSQFTNKNKSIHYVRMRKWVRYATLIN